MKRAKSSQPPNAKPFHNPFARLAPLRGELPPAAAGESPVAPRGPAKAVIRLERKGRSGKEVTVVDQLELPAGELARWHQDLKRSLGCGGSIEGATLVFQGDQRQRLKDALVARGVRRIAGA